MITAKLEGLAELNKTIVKLRENLSKEKVAEVLDPPAEMLKNDMQTNVNVVTNKLRDGIKKLVYSDYSGAVALVVIDYKKAPHAHLVEYGHVNWKGGKRAEGEGYEVKGPTQPHSFFRKTWDEDRAIIERDIVSGLTNLANEAIEQGGK